MKKTEKKANNKRSSMLAVLLAALLVLCAAAGTVIYKKANQKPAEQTAETAQAEETEEEAQVWGDDSFGIDAGVDEALKDYRNILLLGIDNGNRSDVLMILSINKNTNQIKTTTVLRDTYMQIDPNEPYEIDGKLREFYKCNRAYKMNGIYGAMIELNRHMDLNIRECITMDWAGMAKFIDSMGGVEGNIDENMLEFVNGNKPTDDPDAHYKVDAPGQQHLNGWQAVQYLRARKYTGGSPQYRDERNRDVLSQLFDKAKNMSLSELEEIYDGAASDAETNMSRSTLTELFAGISQSTLETMEGWPYEYSTMWQDDNSYYYFVCDTLESNVKEFHQKMFGQESYEPSETVMMLNEKLETARKEQLH